MIFCMQFSEYGISAPLILDSSMVEHSAVNRRVVGSSPTRGVRHNAGEDSIRNEAMRPLGQAVKTPPFHGGNMGSNPVGVMKRIRRHSQAVRQRSATPLSPVRFWLAPRKPSPGWVKVFCSLLAR